LKKISLIIGLCVHHPNKFNYINSIQSLSGDKQNAIMELLEKVLKKVKKELEEIDENEFDNAKEKKIYETLDALQNENTSLKTESMKHLDEIKDLKKKNGEFMAHIKNLLMTQDSRIKERSLNYEDLEAQIRIKDSKIIDLQEKLDQQIKSYGKEISGLKVSN
jgi:predicted RNase H-like nuclease (RuvC/YqgF family)